MPKTPEKSLARRSLLLGLPTAGAALALSTDRADADPHTETDPADHRTVRLKDTAHTRTYYALARG